MHVAPFGSSSDRIILIRVYICLAFDICLMNRIGEVILHNQILRKEVTLASWFCASGKRKSYDALVRNRRLRDGEKLEDLACILKAAKPLFGNQ